MMSVSETEDEREEAAKLISGHMPITPFSDSHRHRHHHNHQHMGTDWEASQ